MNSTKHQQGVAIVIVLMVSMVILMSVLTTTTISTLGSRRGIADEQLSFQSLLAAESAINTFESRLHDMDKQFRFRLDPNASLSKALVEDWLNGGGDGDATYGKTQPGRPNMLLFDVGNNSGVSLELVSVDAAKETMTLRSSSSYASGRGKKIILIDVSLSRSPNSVSVPGAFTTLADSKVSGNSSVAGLAGSTWSGIIDNVATTASTATIPASGAVESFKLSLADASRMYKGAYITIPDTLGVDHSYEITAKEGNDLTLSTITPVGSSYAIASGAAVGLIASAAADTQSGAALASAIGFGSYSFKVSNASQFFVGDKIFMGGYEAKVTAVDRDKNQITINNLVGALVDLPEGTPIRRDTFAVESGGVIDTGAGNIVDDFKDDGSTRLTNLFEDTFGVTKTEMFGDGTNDGIAETMTSYPSGHVFSGITYLKTTANKISFSSSSPLCGSGIVIIENDVSLNKECAAGFSGVLYVMGDFNFSGNGTTSGAVIVDYALTDAKLTGNGSKDLKLNYDPLAIHDASLWMSGFNFSQKSGTWRQK